METRFDNQPSAGCSVHPARRRNPRAADLEESMDRKKIDLALDAVRELCDRLMGEMYDEESFEFLEGMEALVGDFRSQRGWKVVPHGSECE